MSEEKQHEDLIPRCIMPVRYITREDQENYIARLRVTDEQIACIANEEQGSKQWLEYRQGRLTGSNIGAAVGHNPFCSHQELLKRLLWDTFQGNDATAYGQKFEATAAKIYANYRARDIPGFQLTHAGLFVSKHMPWFGYSPDGLLSELQTPGLLEIKCPFSKKFYREIPKYYYDQINVTRDRL
jgi:putative phage-type endonuclease